MRFSKRRVPVSIWLYYWPGRQEDAVLIRGGFVSLLEHTFLMMRIKAYLCRIGWHSPQPGILLTKRNLAAVFPDDLVLFYPTARVILNQLIN